jgi:hypothetical protein
LSVGPLLRKLVGVDTTRLESTCCIIIIIIIIIIFIDKQKATTTTMKTSFSVKVTGSITVSIEPSNEDGGDNGGEDNDGDGGNVLFDALLAPYMNSLMHNAVKKYVTTVEEEHDDDGLSSPLPHRRIPSDADDSVDANDGGDDDDGVAVDETTKLHTEEEDDGEGTHLEVDKEYEADYQLSQKMDT